MSVTLLNENQQRRLGTHLRLLTQDPRIDELRRLLEALADAAQRLPER